MNFYFIYLFFIFLIGKSNKRKLFCLIFLKIKCNKFFFVKKINMQLEETSLVEKGLNRKEREWSVRGEEENDRLGKGIMKFFRKMLY